MAEYNYGHVIVAIVVCLLLGGIIGALAFPTEKEVIVAGDYVTLEGANYTASDVAALIGVSTAALEINSLLKEEYNELNSEYIDLAQKYADDEREEAVLDIAKDTVEDEYIDDLDLDDDIYDNYYFRIMYTDYDVDEDGDTDDYDVEINFRIFQYDEDTDELFDEFDAIATMEVEDDDEVDDLEIVLA